MTRSAVPPESFIRNFRYMWSAHHHRNAGRADRIRYPIRLGDHTSHGADSDQSDSPVQHELNQLGVAHRLRVAIDQNHFMPAGRKRLQQKHPKVGHEVLRDTVVGVIEQDSQFTCLFQLHVGS